MYGHQDRKRQDIGEENHVRKDKKVGDETRGRKSIQEDKKEKQEEMGQHIDTQAIIKTNRNTNI